MKKPAIRTLAVAAALFLLLSPAESRRSAGEVLYNGIQLPSPWPPNPAMPPPDPVTPYYLVNPPAVIPIDVGRQLFVDDFLVSQTTLTRSFHLPTYHSANPVLKADRSWETGATVRKDHKCNVATIYPEARGAKLRLADRKHRQEFAIIATNLLAFTSTPRPA